uniref:ATP synthase subunit a n=1 Tax=uncultured bacterium pSY1435 TaxID=561717 RepID=C4N423_9BACT|nr:ATP synthase F0 A subunit [uncultured bacterium pSY1435]
MEPRWVIHLLGFELPDIVPISVALTSLIGLFGYLLAGRLRVEDPRAWQVALELFVTWLHDTVEAIMDEDADPYVSLIGSLVAWIGICSLLAVIPYLRPPTAELSTTVALALVVLLVVPMFGIRRHGLYGYLRGYLRPHWLLLPFNLIGEVTRTFALAMRLFGNVMSGQIFGAILLLVAGLLIPVPLMLLGLLLGLVQAYIFAILAAIYIAAAVQVEQAHLSEE